MKNNPRKIPVGCIIDASCDSADSLNLETIRFARTYGAKLGRLPSVRNADYSQIVSEMADSAVDHLNGLPSLPEFCFFTFEDNCLFLVPDVDRAKEDCAFVSSHETEFPPTDFRGLWLHVSDHGNAELYLRTGADTAEVNALAAALVDLERQLAEDVAEVAAATGQTVDQVNFWRKGANRRAVELRQSIAIAEKFHDVSQWAIV